MRYFTFLLLVTFACLTVQAQRSHYVDSTGKIYWQKAVPLYLLVADNPDGKNSTRLQSERTKQYADPLYLDTEGVNYIRTRNAVDPVTMRVIPDTEVMFEIYSDGTAPKTTSKLQSTISYKGDQFPYYQGGVSITLGAFDNLSGVAEIVYSINGEKFQPYTDTLSFEESGKFSVKYASADRVGNKEELTELRFYVDNEAPFSDLTVNGVAQENIIATSSKLYIQAYDSLSGLDMVYYKFDEEPFKKYAGGIIPIGELTEGQHVITYYSVDRVKNTEEEKSFSFYLDKSAPIMVADVLGDRFIVGDEIYFSGRTKLKLTAVDNKVGVKEVMYSIDDADYRPYTEPIYLPSISGVHNIRFYSVDNLNNSTADSRKSRYLGSGGVEEYKHNVSKIYVDLTGPSINYKLNEFSFVRNDTLFIGPNTSIELGGEDGESGFKEINYSVNDAMGETPYTGPFTLSSIGYNTLHIYGYDNVNNRNVDDIQFFLDDGKPEIFVTFSMGSAKEQGGLPVYAENAGIYLSATDEIAGVRDLSYSLDDGQMMPYAGAIKNMKRGKHTIKVTAVDHLSNSVDKEVSFMIK